MHGARGTRFAVVNVMTIEPARWDDYVLAGLLLVIGVPRAVMAVSYDHPFGVEDTVSVILVCLGLLLVMRPRR